MRLNIFFFLALVLLIWNDKSLYGQTDQPVDEGGKIFQLGMPPIYKGYGGAAIGWYDSEENDNNLRFIFHGGVSKDLASPIAGIASIGLEAYGGFRGNNVIDGGGRAIFSIPSFHLSTGLDYNFKDSNFSFLLRLESPLRRRGLFNTGAELRLEWLSGKSQSLLLGVNFPLWGRNIGKTRPVRDAIKLDNPPAQKMVAKVLPSFEKLTRIKNTMEECAQWIAILSMPLLDHGGESVDNNYKAEMTMLQEHIAKRDSDFPIGHTLTEEVRVFHENLEEAFSLVMSDKILQSDRDKEQSKRLAHAARQTLLDYILLPYNRLLGQRKSTEGIKQFIAVGNAEFSRWLVVQNDISKEKFNELFVVFESLTGIVNDVYNLQKERWNDNRFVWLPLQLALRAEDHDSYDEISRIIERGTNNHFTEGNSSWYSLNEQFQIELERSVRTAENYHVLWIHDYRGKAGPKKLDEIGFHQTITYLEALTDKVKNYDESGKIPDYFILLDQNYFEANKGRIWFKVLEKPLTTKLNLPKGYDKWEEKLERVQQNLINAIAESNLLQSERRQYGDKWLKERMKIHINITNPVDHSFNSRHLAGIISVPDNVIRDHRKVAFYDLTEEDPSKGMGIFTGMGVGEHYVGRNWEDRALLLRGPAALALKAAARNLLFLQGFQKEEIPHALREKPLAVNYWEQVEQMKINLNVNLNGFGKVLQLHNKTGFAEKMINIEKAILYSLLPPGTIMKVPDSLWMSYFYASMLTGSALRGCQVLIISPTRKSAPSAASVTLSRMHGLLSSVVYFKNRMNKEISDEGGLLMLGLYNPQQGVGDLKSKIEQVHTTIRTSLQKVYKNNSNIDSLMHNFEEVLAEHDYKSNYLIESDSLESPKLHLKINHFISNNAWNTITTHPKFEDVYKQFLIHMAFQTGTDIQERVELKKPQALIDALLDFAQSIQKDSSIAKDFSTGFSYLTVGSTNMNYRSMVLDGEVQVTICDWSSMMGMMDMMLLTGLCEWIEDNEELNIYFAPPSNFIRKVGNFMRLLL